MNLPGLSQWCIHYSTTVTKTVGTEERYKGTSYKVHHQTGGG